MDSKNKSYAYNACFLKFRLPKPLLESMNFKNVMEYDILSLSDSLILILLNTMLLIPCIICSVELSHADPFSILEYQKNVLCPLSEIDATEDSFYTVHQRLIREIFKFNRSILTLSLSSFVSRI